MVLFSVIRAKRRFDVRKKVTKLPELEGGGGGVYLIWAMPERKRAFPYEVFPNVIPSSNFTCPSLVQLLMQINAIFNCEHCCSGWHV